MAGMPEPHVLVNYRGSYRNLSLADRGIMSESSAGASPIIQCAASRGVMHFGFIRNGIFVAIIAHGLIGATLVWDKVLLRRPETRNLFSYVFWLGFISIFGLALAPFGFQMPKAPVVALAFGAGLLHMAAMFDYYAALKAGE